MYGQSRVINALLSQGQSGKYPELIGFFPCRDMHICNHGKPDKEPESLKNEPLRAGMRLP
jgi:hypothetical protein